MPANGLDPFAHAAQAIAFAQKLVSAVVFHQKAAMPILYDEVQAAGLRPRMTHDVGDGFAQRKGQDSFLRGAQRAAALGGELSQ